MNWKDIAGYEGLYLINNAGDVFSVRKGKLVKPSESNSGYVRVTLWKCGKGKHYLLHRLVAQSFLSNPNNYEQVNHIDGNKKNNNSNNLEWCNASQNMKHAYNSNLINVRRRAVEQYTPAGELVKSWRSVKEASKKLGLNHANIITVCKGNTNRKMAGGYIWRYANGV